MGYLSPLGSRAVDLSATVPQNMYINDDCPPLSLIVTNFDKFKRYGFGHVLLLPMSLGSVDGDESWAHARACP